MSVTLQRVTTEDSKLLFDWANDAETRSNSFNSEAIDWETHQRWLKAQLQNPQNNLYLLRHTEANGESLPAGFVRIQDSTIGINVAPAFRGRKLAAEMLQRACTEYWKQHEGPVNAYIKTSNQPSVKAFERAGFKRLKTLEIHGSETLHYRIMKPQNPCKGVLIIAELSANHGQNIHTAIETIRAAKRAGADAIKLQTYTADTLTIDSDKPCFREVLKGSLWEGQTLYQLYREAYTPWDWHEALFKTAAEEGLMCFSTPFDRSAVDFLETFDPPAYKIASFEIQDIPLIQYTASKGRPMILSIGIAETEDIERAVEACRAEGNHQITLLQCTSAYPAPIEQSNLAVIPDLKQSYGVEAGLSDHTTSIVAPVVATALGATVIEKHFILNKAVGGPDAAFSLDEQAFAEMVVAVRQAEKAIGTVTYELTEQVRNSRRFGRSLFVVEDIKAGQTFTEQNIRSIRPGNGLHPRFLNDILGKKATIDLSKGSPLQHEHYK